jgi:aryl-alcohol dehydrogenase-like predicted oxidoreductase
VAEEALAFDYGVVSPDANTLVLDKAVAHFQAILVMVGDPRARSFGHVRYVGKPQNDQIVSRVVEVAKKKGVTPNQVALSWLLHKGVTAPIIGTSDAQHLEEMAGSVAVKISEKEAKYLEEPYVPQPVSGHT